MQIEFSLAQTFFQHKQFSGQKLKIHNFVDQTFDGPNIFEPNIFLGQTFFWTQHYLTQIFV